MNKEITKAIPTINADGNVVKWDIELTYEKEEYKVNFNTTAELEGEKAPESFTLAELKELAKESHWDNVFTSMYDSTHSTDVSTETKVDDFDVNSLA